MYAYEQLSLDHLGWLVGLLRRRLNNAADAGDHLLKTIANGYWPVAVMDLLLLTAAAVAAVTATQLPQPATTATNSTTPMREVGQGEQRG